MTISGTNTSDTRRVHPSDTDAVEVVLQRLRTLMAGQIAEGQADQHLLERFVQQRDEAAFATILERHGPMVLGIGRRALRDEQLAEDVLQATFLVLARNAPTISKGPSLINWLHGVAVRLARRAKSQTARAGRPDTRPGPESSPGPVVEAGWREVRQILDDELQRLPERYRLPLVLCHLEGQTRDEAAKQLGYTLSQLKGLLERGRERLRERLIRRGLAPAAVATALLTETTLAAPVPPLLAVATHRVALRLAAGEGLKECGVSDTVTRLMDGGLRIMGSKKLVLVLILALGLGGFGLSAGLLTDRPHPAASPSIAQAPAALPRNTPEPAAPSLRLEGNSMSVSESQAPGADEPKPPPVKLQPNFPTDPLPTGASVQFGSPRLQDNYMNRCASFSSDGKLLATAGNNGPISVWEVATGKRVETLQPRGNLSDLRWKPDGKIATIVSIGPSGFLMQEFTPGKKNDPVEERKLDEIDVHLRQLTTMPGQDAKRHSSVSLSPDGEWAIGIRDQRTEFYRFKAGETAETIKPVSWVDTVSGGWLSRDGKVLLSLTDAANDQPSRLLAFDVPVEGKGKLAWALPMPGGQDRKPVGCFSLHGKEVVIHFFDGEVELWDGPLGKRIRQFPTVPMYYHHNNGEWGGVDLNSDGKRLALIHRGKDGAVGGRIVDVQTGKDLCQLQPLPMPRINFGICFSPDGSRVARVAFGLVRIWNADTGEDSCPLPGHRGGVTSAAVIGNDKIVTTGQDFTVRAWNPASGAEIWRTGLTELACIAFATPEMVVLVQDQFWLAEKPALYIDVATGQKKPLPGKLGEAKRTYPLAISADGKKVATLTMPPDFKNPTWDFWSWPAGEHLQQLMVKPPDKFSLNYCDQAHFSPDGQQLVMVAYYDDPAAQQAMRRVPSLPFIERWDLARPAAATKGKLLDQSKPGKGNLPQLLSSRKGLWSWTANNEIRDVFTSQLVVKLQFPENEELDVYRSRAAAISADGTALALGERPITGIPGPGRIFVFDLETGKLTCVLRQGDRVERLQFLADGRLLSLADVVTIWNVAGKWAEKE